LPMGNIKNAYKRESIVLHNGEKQKIYLGRDARKIRDKIRESGVLNQPEEKKVDIEIVTPSLAAAKRIPEARKTIIPTPPVRLIKKPVKVPLPDILQVV